MFKPRPWVVASWSAAALMAAATNLPAGERGPEAGAPSPRTAAVKAAVSAAALKTPRLDQFDKYYALSVKPDAAALPHKADAHDIVIVVGTPASQNGEFRARGMATLRALLDKLNPTDRVCLLAADTTVAPMTVNEAAGKANATFVAPQGKDIDAALAKLNRRVPLGSTDMPLLLRTAAGALHGSSNPRALIYIGGGMNIGGSVDPNELKQVVELLVNERIPVTSYGVGPRLDAGLLARLANHTGGVVGFDNAESKADDPTAGAALAAAATEVVVWPEKLQLPEGLNEAFPKRTPPLRADRDTIIVGQGKAVGPIQVSLTGTARGEKKQLSWTITPSAPSDDNAYLAKVVEAAQRDDGESLATVGSAGLLEVRRLTLFQADALRKLAGQVLHADPRLAHRLGKQAAEIDPDLPGQRLEVAFQKAAEAGKAPGDGIVVDLGGKQPAEDQGGLLGKAVQEKKIIGERMQTEVRNQIDNARRSMATNPQGALESLKVLQQAVREEPIIDPELKDRLLRQIDDAMAAIHRAESAVSNRKLRQAEADAVLAENKRLQGELVDREKRISQWMAKFDSLMDDKKYTQAESVADLAMSMAPGNPEIADAGLNATMRRAIDDGIFLRRERIRGVLLMLREVEYSHIPTPDEPPVVYPPKEWWEAMTKRREDYKAVSLSSQSDAEKRIATELQKPTTAEFNETSLKDVAAFWSEMHGINIQIAQKKVEDANVQLDTPITKVLKGVTLKSALKLVLHDLGLAYIIRDEVLLITSKEEADTYLVTKVYPVGDLVVPIVPPQSFGGGQQGAFGQQGNGGFGGGQQGGGGQFGGGGGGQFGGGGQQGGGGGFFSVPSSPFKAFDPQLRSIKLDSPKRDVRPVAPVAAAPAAKPIELKPKQGEDVADAWDRYFDGRKNVTVEEIRATLRRLREDKKYDEIVAVIQASLRHGQSQPWMYEAMALAMFSQEKTNPEDIERALMSAADYANNTTDLMYLGQYIYRSTFYVDQKARQRFQARALKIFRQVAQLDPTAVDAYVHGLTVAKSLDDLDGIRWATVGLMSQAWSSDDRQVVDSATRVAKSTIQRLRGEKRLKEAQAFEDAMADALRRDVVVLVSWTGEADIDLLVEEPSGTWCTAQSPRTTSGGILISSELPGADEKLQGRQVEAYVCPLAFDGKYRLVLRRAFGRPSADKVKVEIVKHHKERRQNLVERPSEVAENWIEIKDQDVVLSFTLDGGRRTRALNDEEIVRSVERAQQTRDEIRRLLWEATDVDSYARAMDSAQQRVAQAPRRGGAPGNNRGVGYQPLIVVIPEGAQLFISAVISGDRRFVRTQVRPQFSFIKEVNTFNFATGASGTSNGGGGGNNGGGGFGGGGQFGGSGGGGGGNGGGGGFF